MIVLLLVVAPLVIGLLMLMLPAGAERAAKWIGAVVAAASLVAIAANPLAPDFTVHWLSRPFDASFHFGYGTASYWIVLLLALATLCALISLRTDRSRTYTAHMLMLQGAMAGVFLSKDLLLFALFWDLMLIPVFMLMIGWGTPQGGRGHHATAAWKYLVYNLVGGLCLLLATAAFGVVHGSTDLIGNFNAHVAIGDVWGFWIFVGFAFAFLVKTPVFPFHTWMPDTYAELPPPVVAVVGAVQSKAGLYGFLVIGLPFFASQMHQAVPVMYALGIIAMLYGAFVALAQTDAKRVVAYSSLSHLGLILIAIFSFDPLALAGAVVYIIAHGLFTASIFLTLGYVEGREETRSLARLGGLGHVNPKLAGAFMLSALAALGLPGLAGFAGELLILTGLYHAGFGIAALIALVPIVLAAAYMLRLFQTVMNGPKLADLPVRRDLTWLEGLAIAPLVIAFILLGINPGPIAGTPAAQMGTPNAASTVR
jgi:NADH-quinone oxidoreductase subunit M